MLNYKKSVLLLLLIIIIIIITVQGLLHSDQSKQRYNGAAQNSGQNKFNIKNATNSRTSRTRVTGRTVAGEHTVEKTG